jgi:hypothetical protein
LTDSPEDRELAEKTAVQVQQLKVSDNVMVSGYKRYLVKSIDELVMEFPKLPVAMTVRAVELPSDDPWIGNAEGEPSNWAIEYTIKGEPKTFRYRINFMRRPERAPIDSVVVQPAGWILSRRTDDYFRAIRFQVRQGASRPHVGYFVLDDYGYPVEASFAGGWPVFDEELSKRWTPWYRWALRLKNHEFDSPEEAWRARPKTHWNRSELEGIFCELLKSTKNPDVRLQVLGAIEATGVIDEQTIPLVERSLDSAYEDEVSAARFILERHAREKARES